MPVFTKQFFILLIIACLAGSPKTPIWGCGDNSSALWYNFRALTVLRLASACAFLAVAVGIRPLRAAVLTNASDVAAVLIDERRSVGDRFDLRGQVLLLSSGRYKTLILGNPDGNTLLHFAPDDKRFDTLAIGDIVRVTGLTLKDYRDMNATRCESFTLLQRGVPPPPVPASGDDILSGKVDFQNVTLRGIVNDAFRDDIDERYVILVVNNGNDGILVPVCTTNMTDAGIQSYIGAEVAVTGFCDPQPQTSRRRAHRLLSTRTVDDVRVIKRADSNPFAVPDIQSLALERPSRISACGRHKVSGRILAVWQGDTFLIKAADGNLCRVQLSCRDTPTCGDYVEAVGFPETDLYRINLSRAVWQKANGTATPESAPIPVRVNDIVTLSRGINVYDVTKYGATVQISGLVRSVPDSNDRSGILYLEADRQVLRVDASACPAAVSEVTIGSRITATGVCIFDTHSWRGNAFPRIDGVRLVIRTPDDILVTSRPSWWTTGRLLALVGFLTLVIALIVVWNLVQRRIAHMRLADRTRLAIELHDSISQNLSSVSLQIDAARELIDGNLQRTKHRLDIASKTIDSCRNELKNCIRDLRDDALDTGDLNSAIRKALRPCIGDTLLSVRFNVPRSRLSDNAAHAVLCIVRELATNAVRHGQATSLRVAGTLDQGQLMFSVSDNGSGFDPDDRPGVDEGHFGLEGVAERIRSLNGRLAISSSPDTGTRITITIAKLT